VEDHVKGQSPVQDRTAIRDQFMVQGAADVDAVIAAVLPHTAGKFGMSQDEADRCALFNALSADVKARTMKFTMDMDVVERKVGNDPSAEAAFFRKLGRVVQHGKYLMSLGDVLSDFTEPRHIENFGHVQHALDVIMQHGLATGFDAKGVYSLIDVQTIIHLCGSTPQSAAPVMQSIPPNMTMN